MVQKKLNTFFSFIINGFDFAQQDTIKADTTRLYKNIESFSDRSKFGKFMHHMFFKPVTTSPKKAISKKGYKKLIQKPYSTFEGKIIRNINIVTLDPFGFSVTDTTVLAKKKNSIQGIQCILKVKESLFITCCSPVKINRSILYM